MHIFFNSKTKKEKLNDKKKKANIGHLELTTEQSRG